MSHTFAKLEVSRETYDEIQRKLITAAYDHAFMDDGAIDMHGIGLVAGESATGSATADVIRAAAQILMETALNIIQTDPHQWSSRPCRSCETVSAILGQPFGCSALRRQ